MRVKKLLLLAALWLITEDVLISQDIHFTQFNMSPMTLNPANTGRFNGTVRVGGIYRNQWSSIIGREFSTPSAWADSPIMRGFRKKDWIGVGLMFYTDRVGVGSLVNTSSKLGGSYHLALNKKATTYLTVGFQFGQMSRKTKIREFEFEDGILASGTGKGIYDYTKSADQLGSDNLTKNFQDFDGGLVLSSELNKKMKMHIGLAMFHLLRPNYALVNNAGGGGGGNNNTGPDRDRLPRRMVLHGQFNIEMNKKWTFDPTFLFQSMSGADEIVLQAMTGYRFNEKQDITLRGGIGYRFRDAANILIGMSKGPLNVGLAYDVNLSDLTTITNYRGGWEIAANYIFKIYKPAVVKPKVLCPRF